MKSIRNFDGRGRQFVLVLLVCISISLLAGGNSNFVETSDAFCAECKDGKYECTTEVVGNDGQTRYKRICCETAEACGRRLVPGDRSESPFCKPTCKWFDLGRTHYDIYDPVNECCSEQYGALQKYPIVYLGRCPNRVPRAGFKPEPNGCGTTDKPVDPTDLAQGKGGKANFTSACNNHDVCYDTCNSDRSVCDKKFLDEMYGECARKYAKGSKALTHCIGVAKNFFYAGARTFGGSAWDSAQQKACQCCS